MVICLFVYERIFVCKCMYNWVCKNVYSSQVLKNVLFTSDKYLFYVGKPFLSEVRNQAVK